MCTRINIDLSVNKKNIYIYEIIYVFKYIHVYVYQYVNVCSRSLANIFLYVYLSTHIYIYIYIYICTNIFYINRIENKYACEPDMDLKTYILYTLHSRFCSKIIH